MPGMFAGLKYFNQDINSWDVSNISERRSLSDHPDWKLPKPNSPCN